MAPARSTLVPVVLIVLGALALVTASPALCHPHYGEAAFDFGVEPVDAVPPDDGAVAFGDLPSGAQTAFRRGLSSEDHATVWVDDLESNATVSALRTAGFVRYDDQTYAVVPVDVDRFALGPTIGHGLIVGGVTLLTLAGLMAYADTDRPLTPLRALWVPLAPVAVTGALAVYDVYVVPPKSADLPILYAATTWIVAGVYLRRRTFGLAVAAGLGAIAVDALITRPAHAVAVAGMVAHGVPWALLGATLAAPSDVDEGRTEIERPIGARERRRESPRPVSAIATGRESGPRTGSAVRRRSKRTAERPSDPISRPDVFWNHTSISLRMEGVLWYLLASSRGGPSRIRILRELDERPQNANQLAGELGLDYTTVRHHLDVFVDNNVVRRTDNDYATVYLLTDRVRANWDTVEEILDTVDVTDA